MRSRWLNIIFIVSLVLGALPLSVQASSVSESPVASADPVVSTPSESPIGLSPAAPPAQVQSEALPDAPVLTNPEVGKAVAPAKTTGLPLAPLVNPYVGEVQETKGIAAPLKAPYFMAPSIIDPVVQRSMAGEPMPEPIVNIEGINNIAGVYPPDTDGQVGPNHYIQMVNLSTAIYDKDGNLLYGPFHPSDLWPAGDPCNTSNDGDVVVLYDQMADRWLLTQFALPSYPNPPFYECIAVSKGPDPTDNPDDWYPYTFDAGGKMNDYPKLAVWPDAYYMTTNQFYGDGSGGAGIWAFDREKMLNGAASGSIYFDLGHAPTPYNLFRGVLPSNLMGSTLPPDGAPNYLASSNQDWSGLDDVVHIFEFHVDWTTPANSTFGLVQDLVVEPFDANLCYGSRSCIPQPGTSVGLDALSDRLMMHLWYRNFGDYSTLVTNQTVDVDGTDHAGVRWYEIRDPGAGAYVYQQGTFAPDADHRWMGSIAMDGSGNIALGYSIASSTLYPSIRYTGREAGDPLGEMTFSEGYIITGTGSQTGTGSRWGDYSAMSVDPVDDCTFWYTQQYIETTGNVSWQTRIASFQFPSCLAAKGKLIGNVTDTSTNPLQGVKVTAQGEKTYVAYSKADGSYAINGIISGTYDLAAQAYGYVTTSVPDVDITEGMTTTQDIEMAVAPRSTLDGVVTDATTGWPLYAQIDIEGYPYDPIWTNPETGAYSVSLVDGIAYTLTVSAWSDGYEDAVISLGVLATDMTVNVALNADLGMCAAPGYAAAAMPSTEDFEASNGGYVPEAGGEWEWGTPTVWPFGCHSGDSCWGTDLDGNYDDHDPPAGFNLTSSVIDLSGSTSLGDYVTAKWWQALAIEEAIYDKAYAEVSINGGAWTTMWEHMGGTSYTDWVQKSYDISAAAGGTVQFRWRLYSDQGLNFEGYYIDDVEVTVGCNAQAGGLVVGNVYNGIGDALTGATVSNDSGASTLAVATVDEAVDDAFYLLFSPAGAHDFTAGGVYGYGASTESVTVVDSDTVTHDFALSAAQTYVVEGTVTDATTGWPLYASVAIASPDPMTIWTDPATGYYSATLYAAYPYAFAVNAWVPGYDTALRQVTISGNTTEDFALEANLAACTAPGYESQSTPLVFENFDLGVPVNWTVVNNGGACVWTATNPGGRANMTGGSGTFAVADSDACGSGTTSNTDLQTLVFDASLYDSLRIEYKNDYYDLGSTAQVDVYNGSSWVNVEDMSGVSSRGPETRFVTTEAGAGAANAQVRWHYASGWDWWWEVDDVRVYGVNCIPPTDGGLVIGNVYDDNIGDPLIGAEVSNADGMVESVATPFDDAVADGFYTLFGPSGAQDVSATMQGGYGVSTVSVSVVDGDVVVQDFDVPAGMLDVAPLGLEATLELGMMTTTPLMLTNSGGWPAPFEFKEKDRGFALTGPFEQPDVVAKPFKQNMLDGSKAGVAISPEAPPFAAGDVIQSWSTGLTLGWGIGYNHDASDLWVGDLAAGGGTDLAYRYMPDGTNTGDTFDLSWAGVFAADMAYNSNTGMLWLMDVGGDDCIHEVDPALMAATGNTICPSWSVSQRGLAYDPTTDTYFAGGWNDTMIYHFAADGTMLASVNTGIGIAGLAYNPATQHVFAVDSTGATSNFYVLDAANAFALVGQFTATGFGTGGAGLEMDCDGNLWAVEQGQQRVYQIGSGEETNLCASGLDWLSEAPESGAVAAGGNQSVLVTFDAAYVDQPGMYYGRLDIKEDTPYVVPNVLVTMTVTPPASWGKVSGTVTGLGDCDADPAPLEEAEVLIESATTGETWMVTTDASGMYQLWLDHAYSPLTVTVMAPDYYGETGGVMVMQGETTVVDFELRALLPCLSYDPADFDVTLPMGDNTAELLTLSNTGAGMAEYEFAEIAGTFISAQPMSLLKRPADGPIDARQAPEHVGFAAPTYTPGSPDILVDEGFEAGMVPPTDWIEIINNSAYNWELGDYDPHSGSYYAHVEYDYDQDEWLLSPEMSLASGTLSFWSFGSLYWCRDTYDNCDLNVWIVVGPDVGDGDDIYVGTADDVWPDTWTWAQSVFDLSPYLPGGPVRIGFQYLGDDGAEIAIDDVMLDGALGGGDAVAWLSEDPISGTLPADSMTPIDLGFDAGVPETMQPGEYHAQIKVNSNAANEVPNVPVTLTVTAPDTWGKIAGVVTGLGYCDVATPTLLEDAEVTIASGTGLVEWLLLTDENGAYQLWLDEAHGPVTITVAYADHVTQVIPGVVVTAGETTVQNVGLRWAMPCLSVDPDMFDVTVTLGMSTTVAMSVTNMGAGGTPFQLIEQDEGFVLAGPTHLNPQTAPLSQQSVTIGDMFAYSPNAPSAPSIQMPIATHRPLGVQTITHSASQTIIALNSVACPGDNDSYLRVFDLSAFGITSDFNITEVQFGIETAAAAGGSQQLTVNLHTLVGDFLWANLTLIGTTDVAVSDQDLTVLTVPVTGNAPAGSVLVVEVYAADYSGGHSFFIGSNNLGQTAPSYISSAVCGAPEPTDIAALGFPGMHIVMNVTGMTDDGAGAIPWLSEDPESGTVDADDTFVVDLTFDASDAVTQVTQPGEYFGTLFVNSDDPVNDEIPVPVTMTVLPPATWGKLMGTVTGLGYCDADPAPVEDADVLIEASDGTTWTLVTDDMGAYAVWLDEGHSPVTITVSVPDHEKGEAFGVSVTGGTTTTLDFDLRWLVPCVGVVPTSLHATLELGATATEAITLTNAGAVDTDWEIAEENFDVVWLAEDPLTGTLVADTGQQVVDVDFDASAVDQPGEYYANLWVDSDDPFAPAILPVTMTVTPPAGWAMLDGTVYSTGYCDAEMNPVEGADVTIENGVSVLVTTDANGGYSYWLAPGTYTVTASAADHTSAVEVVTITTGIPQTRDFTLTWLGPCLTSVEPSAMEVTVAMGMSTTLPLTMTNAGAGALGFSFGEEDAGFQPLAPAAGEDVLVVSVDNTAATAMETALTNLGYTYLDVENTAFQTMAVADLLAYKGVFYAGSSTGDSWAHAMAYLDAGGSLYISDNDLGYYNNATAFYQTYLQATYVSDGGSDGVLTGVDIMAGLNPDISADPYSDDFIVGAEGVEIFVAPSGNSSGVKVVRNGYKAIYTSFDFQYIASSADEQAVIERVVSFLEPLDIPWLDENPSTGTVPATSAFAADIIFDASVPEVTQPGDYMANLIVKTDDPMADDVTVPVIMHVTLPATYGQITGAVMGLGPCDDPLTAMLLAEAEVTIESATQSWTLSTDNNGVYDLWLDEMYSPVTITVMADDYVTGVITDVQVVSSTTTVQDFDLRPEAPCMSVAPADAHVTLTMGMSTTVPISVVNTGAGALDWGVSEADGGFALMAPAMADYSLPVTASSCNSSYAPSGGGCEEIYGGLDTIWSGGARDRGNIFEATEATSISEIRVYLNFAAATDMYFVVYEGDTLLGSYTQIHQTWIANTGTGEGWYSSGPINVPTRAGKFYYVGASWNGSANYYRGTDAVPFATTCFGTLHTGMPANLVGYPPAPTANNTSYGSGYIGPYYFAIVTGDAVPWLDEDPTSGTVAPEATAPVTLTFDASVPEVTQPGDYYATLTFRGGDSEVEIPVSMTVEAPATWGKLEGLVQGLGYCNVMTTPLEGAVVFVESTVTTDTWTVETGADGMYGLWLDEMYSPFTVTVSYEAGYDAQVFTGVEVNGGEITTRNANLFWLQPCITVAPDALEFSVPMGTSTTVGLNLANMGAFTGSFLLEEWSLGFEMLGPLATGGPDSFGYRFADSNTAGISPVYDFVDISGAGMPVMLGDNDSEEVAIGFDFKFYGASDVDPDFYDTVFVNSNGFLSFGTGSTDISPDPLPDPTLPNNLIAAAWDDLVPGTVYVQSFGQCPYNPYPDTVDACFIVQYDGFTHADSTPAGTWELILFRTGSILMQYAEVDAPDATTGIEGPLGLSGLNYGPALADELAICFAYPGEWLDCQSTQVPWLDTDVDGGDVPAYDATTIAVTLDASVPEASEPGTYMADLLVYTNDSMNSLIVIPVTMTVDMPATMGKMWGTVYAWGYCDAVSATMAGAQVMIEDGAGGVWMTHTDAAGNYGMWLPAGAVVTMTVMTDGYIAETMVDTVTTGVMPAHDVELHADMPCISCATAEYNVIVAQGESTTRTLTLVNDGAGELTFDNYYATSLWLSVAPGSGVIAPYSSQEVTLVFDSTGLALGVYNSSMEIIHNDPEAGRMFVRPIQMTVVVGTQYIYLPLVMRNAQ